MMRLMQVFRSGKRSTRVAAGSERCNLVWKAKESPTAGHELASHAGGTTRPERQESSFNMMSERHKRTGSKMKR